MSARLPGSLDAVEYARQVRLALRDITPSQLDELLEDLDEHLAEIATDTSGTLRDRLGPPGVYAQELREAAGLRAPVAVDAARRLEELREAAARLGRHGSVQSVLAFLPELRPAWWVLRGWLAVLTLGYLSGYHSLLIPFGVLLGPPLILAAMALSVRLGRHAVRRADQNPRQRLVTLGANAGLALVAFIALAAVQQQQSPVYASSDPGSYSPGHGGYGGAGGTLARPDGSPITNIYPYSVGGQPLTGVLLYDQDGRALDNLALTTREGVPVERIVPTGPPAPANAYPQQQRPTSSDPSPSDPAPSDPGSPIPSTKASPSATGQAPLSGVPMPPDPTSAVSPNPSSTGPSPATAGPGVASGSPSASVPAPSTLLPGQ